MAFKWIERWRDFLNMKSEARQKNSDPKIYVSSITFSDGTEVSLKHNSIFVITGPNNSGKSSSIREIVRYLEDGIVGSPVVKDVKLKTVGTAEEFGTFVRNSALSAQSEDAVRISHREYKLKSIPRDMEQNFAGSSVSQFFCFISQCRGKAEYCR